MEEGAADGAGSNSSSVDFSGTRGGTASPAEMATPWSLGLDSSGAGGRVLNLRGRIPRPMAVDDVEVDGTGGGIER